jgi:heparin/heparan-sulfate lyase
MRSPALREAREQIEALSARLVYVRLEWEALGRLMAPDEAKGRRIVGETLEFLRATTLPRRGDAARVTGRAMVTGAIVYDWLYGLLTAADRQAYRDELMRLAHTLECGYPPLKQGSISGHSSEAMLMRDLLAAGVALYDEFPEPYDLAAARFFSEHLPARNWFYSGHAYHQGDSYSPYRFTWDMFALFLFDRLGFGNVYNPEQRWVPYHFLYSTRPDGQRLRSGDTFYVMTPKGRPWSEELGTVLAASYYRDPVLLGQHLRQRVAGGDNSLFEFLWRDPGLHAEPPDRLPLSRYFGPPFGWSIARSGWGERAAIVEMKVNEYNFANHQHLDAGAFQIYYRGPLAIDSGLYSGSAGAYGSPHCRNYYWRTIAHNCLLIHDPNEDPGAPGYVNDGGQRPPNQRREPFTLAVLRDAKNGYRTASVLGHAFGPDAQTPAYTLLQGDLTRAYGPKAREVRRSFVFLNLGLAGAPAALIVFDRVVSARADFRKYWLLHSMEEPRVSGPGAVMDAPSGQAGRLYLEMLLPERVELQTVGGPGKEFWVFGENHPNQPRPIDRERGSVEAGAWRIEATPAAPALEDRFLAVMQVADREGGVRLPVAPLAADERSGCVIEGPDHSWAVLFRNDAARSARGLRFHLPGGSGRRYRCLVCDLAPGPWMAERAFTVDEASGAAWLEGSGGEWTLQRAGAR